MVGVESRFHSERTGVFHPDDGLAGDPDPAYRAAVEYLNGFVNFERDLEPRPDTRGEDIVRFRRLLAVLGDPQRRYPVIHIAGTKGKGSTAAIIASVLAAAGYRVGLYTSPHLITVRERIRIDDRMVSQPEFAQLIDVIRSSPDDLRFGDRIAFRTVFEHLTAAALTAFAHRGVDCAVVEAGLGGRLDATVTVDPALTVMTPIGRDHTGVLGDTVAMIATDKAHVIKRGIPVVTAPQVQSALEAVLRRARSMSAPVTIAPGRIEFDVVQRTECGTVVRSSRSGLGQRELKIALAGDFQLDNASTALTAIERLRSIGFDISPDAVVEGLRNVNWEGRLQFISERPTVVLDGAHNSLAVRMVKRALDALRPGGVRHIVFSAHRGKPVSEMLGILDDRTCRFYFAPQRFPKSLTMEELERMSRTFPGRADVHPEIPAAFAAARSAAAPDDTVLVVGSLYTVGEVLRDIHHLPPPTPDGKIDTRI